MKGCCIKLAYFVYHHHNFIGLSVCTVYIYILKWDGYCHALVNLIVFHSHTHDIVTVASLQIFCYTRKVQGTEYCMKLFY
jgi:hypothetical protein